MVGDEDFEQQMTRAVLNMQEQNSISTKDHGFHGEAGGSVVTPNAQEQAPDSCLLGFASGAVGSSIYFTSCKDRRRD